LLILVGDSKRGYYGIDLAQTDRQTDFLTLSVKNTEFQNKRGLQMQASFVFWEE
jgi:hypothetical protein